MTFPLVRADCAEAVRPCPWVSCRHHLAGVAGARPLEELTETCALDLAELGGMTLLEVATLYGVSRERIRQIETGAMNRLRKESPGLVALLP